MPTSGVPQGTGRGGRSSVGGPESTAPVDHDPPLGAAGAALWASVTGDFELDDHEALLLLQAARTADLIATLDRVLADEGVLADSSQGVPAHPALTEVRKQRLTYARLIAALRLPAGVADDRRPDARPQRRLVRGVYAV